MSPDCRPRGAMRFAQKMETCGSKPGSAAYLSPNGFKEGDYAKRGGFEIMREFSRLKHVGATRETNSQPRKYDRRFAKMAATSRLSDVLTGDGEMALHTALSQMTYLTRGVTTPTRTVGSVQRPPLAVTTKHCWPGPF